MIFAWIRQAMRASLPTNPNFREVEFESLTECSNRRANMGSMVLSFSETFSDATQGSTDSASGIPRITLRQLIYFAAAAEKESALRAAEELNVSPPAISGAISCLEGILGEQLFIRRHARGLVLTQAGHHLLMEARDIIGRVREIESVRLRRSCKLRTRISLGCLGDIAPCLVPPLVRTFNKRYPNVEIRWHTGEHANLMQRLEDGNLDVIIVLDFDLTPALHSTLLQPSPAYCVLPTGHFLANNDVSLQKLSREPFIMLDIARTRDYFLSVFGEFGLQPNVAYRASSAEMVRSMVSNGFGYSLLNFCLPDRRGIVYRPLDGHVRPSNLVAVRQHRRRPSKLMEDLLNQARCIAEQCGLNGMPAQ
jgi:DNA-binding transcriptional LysR family regulator